MPKSVYRAVKCECNELNCLILFKIIYLFKTDKLLFIQRTKKGYLKCLNSNGRNTGAQFCKKAIVYFWIICFQDILGLSKIGLIVLANEWIIYCDCLCTAEEHGVFSAQAEAVK